MKTLQRFSDDYLESSRGTPPEEILRFLDDFRQLHAPERASRLISMRVPEPLLDCFKRKCKLEGIRYQTRIKALMAEWLGSGSSP